MNLEKQVTSLELCKRLKELGVKQKSLFYWIKESDPYIWYNSSNYPIHVEKFFYSAFTVSELGVMLPTTITWPDGTYALQQDFYTDGFFSVYYTFNFYASIDFNDENEANARAKMLIYLIENNLMKV